MQLHAHDKHELERRKWPEFVKDSMNRQPHAILFVVAAVLSHCRPEKQLFVPSLPWSGLFCYVARECGFLSAGGLTKRECACVCHTSIMAPKKRKMSKAAKKKLAINRGKASSASQGKGSGSRKKFVLPAKWKEFQTGSKKQLKFSSPGKTVYNNPNEAKEALKSKGMKDCFNEPTSSSLSSGEGDSEYEPLDIVSDEEPVVPGKKQRQEVVVEQRLFVCETSQLMDFVDQFNNSSRCSTENCHGRLEVTKVEVTGLGGTLNVHFQCSGCEMRSLAFQGSSLVEGSKRTVIGLALGVAFFLTGHGFANFDRTLKQYLGISCISKNRFYDIIKLAYPHIKAILDEMCSEEKERMKELPDEELGSWKRAVVTSDGVWQTRGHFSKNGSFIIKNYMTGGLLWYGHKCMRGNDDVVGEDLYEGTSKSMEGVLSDECYEQAKVEGCSVEVVWQDGDSSSANSVKRHHPDGKVYKCGGHVGRAHTNNLKEAAKKKEFSAATKSQFKEKFPQVETAKCKCTRHKAGCGCLSDSFIKGARINHFCCLQQCSNPEEYQKRIRTLAQYHVKDIHQWKDGGVCGFHPTRTCICKKCDNDEEPKCAGTTYKTKHPLTCEYHWLAYRVECERRAMEASSVIHPTMGRGHSNLCEANFTVLPQFRSKSQSLCRLHYMASTNAGFCQGNMTWCFKVRGPNYHWVVDLYERLNLPVVPAVVEALRKATMDRASELEKQKSERRKQSRIRMKVARAEDQEARKKWVKQQAVRHTYGREDSEDEGEVDAALVRDVDEMVGDDEQITVVSGRKCRCGSTEHSRISHKSCPYNKQRK